MNLNQRWKLMGVLIDSTIITEMESWIFYNLYVSLWKPLLPISSNDATKPSNWKKLYLDKIYDFGPYIGSYLTRRDNSKNGHTFSFAVHIVLFTKVLVWFELTPWTHVGNAHLVIRSLCDCSRPCWSTCLFSTSIPVTPGFNGFGYFLHAAFATVSHGCLQKHQHQKVGFTSKFNC